MVGLPALMCSESTPSHCFIQVAGIGFRIKAEIMAREFQRSPRLRQRLLQFFQAQLVQTAQIAACNRRDEVGERLARWLLMCHDRSDSETILLTHEFLRQMLGAPRSTVTLAAGMLQHAGLIDYSRGRVTIGNRKGLELLSVNATESCAMNISDWSCFSCESK